MSLRAQLFFCITLTIADSAKDESAEDIARNNIFAAEKLCDLGKLSAACFGLIRAKGYTSWQEVEKYLRANKCATYLIAASQCAPKGFKLAFTMFADDEKRDAPKYNCLFSCRPQKYALAELMEWWPSYEKNFDALAHAGVFVTNDAIDDGEKNINRLTPAQTANADDIANNCKKFVVNEVTVEEFLTADFNQCKKMYGDKVEYKFCGVYICQYMCFALMCDGKRVLNYGYYRGFEKDAPRKLLDFRDCAQSQVNT